MFALLSSLLGHFVCKQTCAKHKWKAQWQEMGKGSTFDYFKDNVHWEVCLAPLYFYFHTMHRLVERKTHYQESDRLVNHWLSPCHLAYIAQIGEHPAGHWESEQPQEEKCSLPVHSN